MSYLLSIVIPTRNRYKYLFHVVRTLENLDKQKVEIIIADNTIENQDIMSFLNTVDCRNIKYFHNIKKMSQMENSDYAVSKCSGDYICYIGDDDTVTERLLYWVDWMKKNNVEAINFSMAGFDWPDVQYGFGKRRMHGRIPYCTGGQKMLNTEKILIKELKNGAQSIKYLPRIYHGVISRDLAKKIYIRCGSYFPGPSPDMANAIATSLLVRRHFFIDEPLMISGVGYDSAGGKGLRGEHKGALKNAEQLPDDVEEKWDINIPKFWVGNAIWLQSAIEALKKMKCYNKYKIYINYYIMYARSFIKYQECRKEILKQCNTPTKKIKLAIYILTELILAFSRKVILELRNCRGLKTDNVTSIEEMYEIVNQRNYSIYG